MSVVPSPFDASRSGLGYLHQFRCALLLALQQDDSPQFGLSIEKLDDVALHESNGISAPVTELRQHKLHLNRQGTLGDKSPDVWKTLRVWAEAVLAGKIDLDRVRLCLITTSQANERNSIWWLRPSPPHRRDAEKARATFEQAGASSKNAVVKEAHRILSNLDERLRQKLFARIYLLDGGVDATAVRREIRRCIWPGCIEKHRDAFVDRLEGWWINLVVQHLIESSPSPIPIYVVQQQVHEIGAFFRRECLPDDLIGESVPVDAIAAKDESNFVRQLLLVGISPARMKLALEDHYRAFTQRSRWAKEQLLGFDEETKYEERLVVGWRERFLIMVEGVTVCCDDSTLAEHGSNLYNWIVTEAPSKAQLWFRPDFQSDYMTKGSYHMLADQLRVGWHPHYETRLTRQPDKTALQIERSAKGRKEVSQ